MTNENSDESLTAKIVAEEKWSFKEVVLFFVFVAAIVLPFRMFVAQPFIVSGQSMDPTFANGQYLIVDQFSYYFENPQRGDVIVFKLPNQTSKFLIKRLIGLPGETVKIEGHNVYVKNTENDDSSYLKIKDDYVEFVKDANVLAELGDDEYFVLGDNRANSLDSRLFGSIGREYIVGRVLVRLFPFNSINWRPGKFEI